MKLLVDEYRVDRLAFERRETLKRTAREGSGDDYHFHVAPPDGGPFATETNAVGDRRHPVTPHRMF